jgi:ABC-type protease/lipase transport system fused ATPase/permease subunit
MGTPLNRRAVLQSGALVAGALAIGAGAWDDGARAQSSLVAGETETPIAGRLTAWVGIDAERGAWLRLVELAAPGPRDVLATALAAGSVTSTLTEADAMALGAVARSWHVPQAECAIGHGCIVHRSSGRSVPYGVWADFA